VLQEALSCQPYCSNGKNIDSSVDLQASATTAKPSTTRLMAGWVTGRQPWAGVMYSRCDQKPRCDGNPGVMYSRCDVHPDVMETQV
jgi:hypothetical protein